MHELGPLLDTMVARANSDAGRKAALAEWIDGYQGKVIEIRTPTGACHLVFTHDEARWRQGEYPAPDVTYHADESVMAAILNGKANGSAEVRQRRVKLWGNFHETFRFEKAFCG